MVTKANLITKIQSMLSLNANKTSRANHEEFLHTDANSFLECIYGAGVSDTNATGTYTTSNANFSYDISFFKVGSLITVSGRFTALASVSTSSEVFTVTDTNLIQETGARYDIPCVKTSTNETLHVFMSGSSFFTNETIISGEGFRFELTYKAQN